MSNPGESEFIRNQRILPADVADQYSHLFGDQYWWADPTNAPIQKYSPSVRASRVGKGLLNLYPEFNGGMLRLGQDKNEDETALLTADRLERGTIVRANEEMLLRDDRLQIVSSPNPISVISRPESFAIIRYLGETAATYKRSVTWWAVAEASKGGLAFFPLQIDHQSSYSSGLSSDVNPALKVAATRARAGQRTMPLKRTTVTRGKDILMYGRTTSAAIYRPLSSPSRRLVQRHFRHT